jgi:hypothetical protein
MLLSSVSMRQTASTATPLPPGKPGRLKPSSTDDVVIGQQQAGAAQKAKVANLQGLFEENRAVAVWYQLCDYGRQHFSHELAKTCLG